MIPRSDIQAWRNKGFPWKTDAMIEQDLIITRVLIELFEEEKNSSCLLFRGGTALHKLFFDKPLRYSEDMDLVQLEPGPIGPVFNSIRDKLIDWLGEPKRKIGPDTASLIYKVNSEDQPPLPLKIKIEINIREHLPFLSIEYKTLEIQSLWYEGKSSIAVHRLEELLATKLRALYQRRKGRDLFDLATALRTFKVDSNEVVDTFIKYCKADGIRIRAKDFRENLKAKLDHPGFAHDCDPILRPGWSFDFRNDCELIDRELLSLLT